MSADPQQSSEASLEFLTGPLANTVLPVTRSSVTIGRNVGNDIILMDPKISRSHARLTYAAGVWRIERLSRTSGITVDTQSVEQSVLHDKSVVGLGEDVSFTFRVETLSQVAPATRVAGRAARPATTERTATTEGTAARATVAPEVSATNEGPLRTELASLERPWHSDVGDRQPRVGRLADARPR